MCLCVGHGQARTVTKQVKVDSFFNFFSPPEGEHGGRRGRLFGKSSGVDGRKQERPLGSMYYIR